jgi:hypothetical protein
MAEVPRHQIIDLVKRRNRNVQRIGNVLAMKDAARDVTFREYRRFFSQINLLEILINFRYEVRCGSFTRCSSDDTSGEITVR